MQVEVDCADENEPGGHTHTLMVKTYMGQAPKMLDLN